MNRKKHRHLGKFPWKTNLGITLASATPLLRVAGAALCGLSLAAIHVDGREDPFASLGEPAEHRHVTVYYEEGKFGGWPANFGAWAWDQEILVGFTLADHLERSGHTYDRSTSRTQFARSLDGGETWKIEDGYASGITGATFEHQIGDKSQPTEELSKAIDFEHPDFAMTFRMENLTNGPSSYYYSYDRGRSWNGPFDLQVAFPDRTPTGIVSRTDYIVDGPHSMTAFLTVAFREEGANWREVACVRTTDGGRTWKHLAWIGPERVNSIMPSSLRLSSNRMITTMRRTNPPEMASYLTENNGLTWRQLPDPATVDANGHPPALLRLKDGRLALIYGIRRIETTPEGRGMYATFSSDEGLSWSQPILVRGKDGVTDDMGYPVAFQRPDGKIITIYYYNHADLETAPPYRYIAATIFKAPAN